VGPARLEQTTTYTPPAEGNRVHSSWCPFSCSVAPATPAWMAPSRSNQFRK